LGWGSEKKARHIRKTNENSRLGRWEYRTHTKQKKKRPVLTQRKKEGFYPAKAAGKEHPLVSKQIQMYGICKNKKPADFRENLSKRNEPGVPAKDKKKSGYQARKKEGGKSAESDGSKPSATEKEETGRSTTQVELKG